jgi:hypothetical protein
MTPAELYILGSMLIVFAYLSGGLAWVVHRWHA